MKKDFEAELTFLTTEEGGRKGYASSGYRPHVEFMKIRGVLTSGQQTYLNKELVYPGEKVNATITTLMSDYLVGMLQTGDQFTFNEGARLIGRGIITKILRKELDFDQIPSRVITNEIVEQFNEQLSTDSIKEIDFNTPEGFLSQVLKDFEVAEKLSNKTDYLNKLDELIDRLSDSDETKQKIKHITKAKKS